jgi:hypothetical protein
MSSSRHKRRDGHRCCVVCGSTKNVENNHIGGHEFLAWCTMPFCQGECHKRFHVLARQAGLVLERSGNSIEDLRRALAFIRIVDWMLLERMKNELEKINEKQPK